jgi:rSAM/selenodomain-associated transferase 1
MKAAFQQAFDQGYRHVLIIGTDCWELRADILEEGLKALDTYEVVIGPAKDGGYYLLGMQKMYRSLFENINWSTSTVFSDTMKEVRNLELEAHVLEVLSDVDTYEDLDNKVKTILDIA